RPLRSPLFPYTTLFRSRPVERLPHTIAVGRQPRALDHDLIEDDERGLIVAAQSAQQAPRGAFQVVETIAGDALAHVEGEDDVQRNLLEAGEVHVLTNPVVEDFEVRGL